MSDKIRNKEVFQTMKDKYVALGDDNTTSDEWVQNIHRDTYNLMLHSSSLLEYTSLASGSGSKFDTKLELLKKLKQPQFKNHDKRTSQSLGDEKDAQEENKLTKKSQNLKS